MFYVFVAGSAFVVGLVALLLGFSEWAAFIASMVVTLWLGLGRVNRSIAQHHIVSEDSEDGQ